MKNNLNVDCLLILVDLSNISRVKENFKERAGSQNHKITKSQNEL